MKTRDLAETLATFAKLIQTERGDELQALADVFRLGKDETVAQRLKKLSRASSHPASLRNSLQIIHAGFKAAGANKQVNALDLVLGLFVQRGDADVTSFIGEISTPPPKARSSRRPPQPDTRLARELADDLVRTTLDTEKFQGVITKLRNNKLVNTPTLALVANQFLGNEKKYRDRKQPISDILQRQKADAREHARGIALDRVGV